MGKNRFASAGTTRIDLSEGDWIEVKNELSYGDRQQILASGIHMAGIMEGDESVSLDWTAVNIKDMEMWLVDWSFCDEQGARVPLCLDSIRALNESTAAEVDAALTAHKEAQQKNAPATPDSTD